MPEPYELTLAQAAAAYARRALSPEELVPSLLQRSQKLDASIQAWETLDAEGALAQARASAERLRSGRARPLEGLPFGVKDIIYTAGLRTSAGFKPYEGLVPSYDAAVVARLKEAGAIILGKTVTTQFAVSDPARTCNPWRLERTPGGSSSGSAAAVAARMAPAALGTQTAGSVLRPAAYCGVVGFKPTFGRVSRYGVIPLSYSLDHVGVIVRSVEDAALALQALAGHDPRDPASSPRAAAGIPTPLSQVGNPPRLGLVQDLLDRAQPEVREHVRGVSQRLAGGGAAVQEVHLPLPMELILAVHRTIMQAEAAAVHAGLLAAHADHYGPMLRAYLEVGHLIPSAAYLHAQRLRRRFRTLAGSLFEGVDVLLTPTVSNTAPDRSTTGDPSFQGVWTLLGYPTISLPSGLSADGLPFGVQLVAPPFAEGTLLTVARWCEAALGPMPAPPLPSS
ncbi:MAG: amidase [Chloroflexi bacterium]|nr:amidase [Chloroflexota bacterium]